MSSKDAYGSILCFTQGNPSGPGQGSVPALLRRIAASIEDLGEIKVFDATFFRDPGYGGDEDDVRMTVYYHRIDESGGGGATSGNSTD